jgi:putative nucleotidyltransferase with HDIG domain
MARILKYSIEQILEQNQDLPSLPASLLQVIDATSQSDCNVKALTYFIAQDPALSVRVLKLANSAYYGQTKKVDKLLDAVMIIGLRNIRNLAIAASAYTWLSKPLEGYFMEPLQLWRESFSVAVGAELIAQKATLDKQEVAFTAGLLHDVGKVALNATVSKKMSSIMNVISSQSFTLDQAEKKIIGLDHTEVGEALANLWKLPTTITEAIRYHHQPQLMVNKSPIVDCVHLGLSLMLQRPEYEDRKDILHQLDPLSIERLKLPVNVVDILYGVFEDRCREYESDISSLV